MYIILESLFVGNFHEAQDSPPPVTVLLWAAGNQRITTPEKFAYACIPLMEYAEADPIDLEVGVDWLEQHLPLASYFGLLSCWHEPRGLDSDGVSLLCQGNELS